MTCDWLEHDGRDDAGKCCLRCLRCGHITKSRIDPTKTRVRSECQAWPRRWEIGHWLALALALAGVTEGRVNWLRGRLGMIEPCDCPEQIEQLNNWGARLARWWMTRRGESKGDSA